MDLDPILLSRLQFAFTISFHIVFPAFTIGLSAWIATLLGMALATGRSRYRDLAAFWTKVFAVSFAMGVVSGIVLTYQFGTNWSRYSEVVGNVVGPLIGYEVLTAFFLEASFLGIMLFGRDRVPAWLHFVAALLVAIGTAISAFWIISANSWMQVPAGHEVRDGIAYPVDWWSVIFNPTFPLRLTHMLIAAYITTGFVILAVGARWWLAGKHLRHAETMIRMALGILVVLTPLQIVVGDFHGLDTLKHQPAKIAAIEAHWENDGGPVPLVVFAWPDEKAEMNRFEIAIPMLGSLILTHSLTDTFKALKEFAVEDRPPVWPVFFSFRVMVGLGFLMLTVAVIGSVQWWRGRVFEPNPLMRVFSWMWPVGFLAVIAGWITTEIGRQPWVATGILRTADAVSPVSGLQVATSLVLFLMVYAIIFTAGIVYINRLLRKGPIPLHDTTTGLGNRPIASAQDAGRVAAAAE